MFDPTGVRIPQDLAQVVADAAMADVAYNVNIIDAAGVIIASGDAARLGQVHSGALLALSTGEPVEVTADEGGQRTGINLPFTVDGQVIGVVGITGPLNEVRPLARLVRSSVTLIVEQNLNFAKERYDVLAATLAAESEGYSARVAERAMAQGLDLFRQHTAVLVDGPIEALQKFNPPQFVLPGGVFLLPSEETDDTVSRWLRDHPDLYFFVSDTHALVRHCLSDVKSTRDVQRRLEIPGRLHRFAQLEHIVALMAVPKRARHGALDQHPDLALTLRAYIAHNTNMGATATHLFIHRNTLLYRLDKVHQLTGCDPRELLELISLVSYVLHTPPPTAL